MQKKAKIITKLVMSLGVNDPTTHKLTISGTLDSCTFSAIGGAWIKIVGIGGD